MNNNTGDSKHNKPEIFIQKKYKKSKGAALVLHGLNMKPEKMSAIADILLKNGIDVIQGVLSGHEGNLNKFKKVTYQIWMNDLIYLYKTANNHAKKLSVPLYFAGFSLGALFNLTLMSRDLGCQFFYKKMILFSPAICLRFSSYLLKLLRPFKNLAIPSLNNREYRVYPYTPVSAYNAFFTSLNNFKHSDKACINIPTLVFIDPKDRLVKSKGIQKIILKNNLTEWEIVNITAQNINHHLIIDKESVGENKWRIITQEIKNHLFI